MFKSAPLCVCVHARVCALHTLPGSAGPILHVGVLAMKPRSLLELPLEFRAHIKDGLF